MNDPQSLAHMKWECKYHVVWIPKYRKKKLFEPGGLRKELGPALRELARHKESKILEGRFLLDHVHMLIAIPPKYAVSQVVGYIRGKSAIHIARCYGGRHRNSRVSISGREAILSRRLGSMKVRSGSTFDSKKTNGGSPNCDCYE